GTYRTGEYAGGAVDGASIRSVFVENMHADGPNVYAHEQYVLNGGEPGTTYQVVLMIFPGDPTCSGNPIVIPTASLRTNAAGNGTAYHVFTPEDAGGLRGLTVGGRWFLVDGGGRVEHRTSPARQPDPGHERRTKGPAPPPPPSWRNWLIFLGIALTVVLLLRPSMSGTSPTTLSYSQFLDDVRTDKVQTATIDANGGVAGQLTDGTGYRS